MVLAIAVGAALPPAHTGERWDFVVDDLERVPASPTSLLYDFKSLTLSEVPRPHL